MDHAVHIQADPTEVTFIKDDTWKYINIAGLLDNPDDCVGVIIRAHNTHETIAKFFGAYPGTGEAFYNRVSILNSVVTVPTRVVHSGAARFIYIRATDANVGAYIQTELYSPGAVMHESAIDKTPVAVEQLKTWLNYVITPVGDDSYEDVEAAIINVHHHAAPTGEWGARWWGSTSDYRAASWQNNEGHVQLVKTGHLPPPLLWAIYQVWIDGKVDPPENWVPYQSVYECGYIKQGYGFEAIENFELENFGTTVGWETRTCSNVIPANATGVFGQIGRGDGSNAGVHKIGETPPNTWRVKDVGQDTDWAVQLNASQQFEFYIQSPREVLLHGYTFPPATLAELALDDAVVTVNASGDIGARASLDLSPAIVALIASAVITEAPLCDWLSLVVGADWRSAHGARAFTSPAAGAWRDAEDVQEFTSPTAGGWRTRKPCG